MGQLSNEEIFCIINKKRTLMIEAAEKYGLNSKQVLKRSKELDDFIMKYMNKYK